MDIKDFIDTSNSLMESFKASTPGTYRHCQNVAQLCEPIAKELQLDIDGLVVAATLHDIGKCNNPDFFSENQADNKNPHDELDPPVSFQYISRHIADSSLKLLQLGLPSGIIRMVAEHHGDSLVKAIYSKAKDKYNGSIVEDHYRYKSCKPSTIESCVLMVCDVVESACRSLHNHDKLTDVKDAIDKLTNSLVDDEQLDVLTIGHIRVIKKILIKEIENIFHKRVDYDLEDESR